MDLDPLLAEVEGFLAETGIAPAHFGRAVMKDSTLVPDLRRGRELRRRTAAHVRQQIAYYRRHGKFGGIDGQDTTG